MEAFMKTKIENPKEIEGRKKCPMHLLPPEALRQIAYAHQVGEKKYGRFNWRDSKVSALTYVGAIYRHLGLWQDGEDNDPESGLSHLAHIAAGVNILLDAAYCGTLVDDRSKKPGMTREEILVALRREDIALTQVCGSGDVDFAIPEGLYGNPKSTNDPHGVFVEPPVTSSNASTPPIEIP